MTCTLVVLTILAIGCSYAPAPAACTAYPPPGTYRARSFAELAEQFPGTWRLCPRQQSVVIMGPQSAVLVDPSNP